MKLLKKIGKILVILLILVLIGIIAALGVAYFFKNRDLNDIYSQYNQATDNLNKSDQENKITINNLQDSYKELNQKIDDLTKENNDLKSKVNVQGFGIVKGTILPFIVGDATLGQYQLVCASNISNANIQNCVSVSSLEPKFMMALPEGSYNFTARIQTADAKSTMANYRATYSEYIQCVSKNGLSKCDKSKLTKAVQVDVKAGQTLENVNPIDWATLTP
ncbi:MAG: hypothetical protein ABI721_03800 [Candidatus Dojkabacteria bacterium]